MDTKSPMYMWVSPSNLANIPIDAAVKRTDESTTPIVTEFNLQSDFILEMDRLEKNKVTKHG